MVLPERLERLRKALLEEQSRLREDLETLQPDLLGSDTNAGVGNHPAEDASMTYEQEALVSMRRNQEATLERVERALRRMDEGTYGTCERCGQDIDYARLKAQPYAILCMDCQRIAEQ